MGVKRRFVDTEQGQVHYAEAGTGPPVLLLHQTPRSWAEFRDVLPLLGRRHRAIAMDMIGFGDSVHPPEPVTIEACAGGAVALLDALGVERASVVGHHTGGYVAVEVAAAHPTRVERLVVSSVRVIDAEARAAAHDRPPVDQVEVQADGSHLAELWQRRVPFYPPDRPDLLHHFVLDAMKVLDRVEEGHHAVHRYVMEDALPRITAPTLVLVGADDPFAYPHRHRVQASIEGSRLAEIPGGMVPLPDQLPEEFAREVMAFLDET
jgi:pimeloyl-ACP methyl ester carboxylesterase